MPPLFTPSCKRLRLNRGLYLLIGMGNVSQWPLLAILFWSVPAIGQINGRFYLEKTVFASGEPVFLYFEVSNSGPEVHGIVRADPYASAQATRSICPAIRAPHRHARCCGLAAVVRPQR